VEVDFVEGEFTFVATTRDVKPVEAGALES
jgi:hypothetical protein